MSSSQKSLSRKKQPVAVEQDSRVSAYTPEKTNIESYLADNPTLTSSQFRQVVDYAFKLQEAHDNFEARQIAVSDLEKRAVEESKREDNEINIAAISRVASDLGLRGEYLETALRLYHPTTEEKNSKLERFDSKPTNELIEYNDKLMRHKMTQKCEEYVEAIKQKFFEELPYAEIEISNPRNLNLDQSDKNQNFLIYLNESKIIELESKRWRIFGKKGKKRVVKEKKIIAEIEVRLYPINKDICLDITAHKPIFLEVCSDIIDRIEDYFPGYSAGRSLFHSYNPEE